MITDRKAEPLASTSPSGYGPADFHAAYALPANAPTTQTIAIVDAYDDPTIEGDLAVYSSTYGLPSCTTANGCFRKVNQNGVEGPYPKKDAGWALEIALDVETAHGICQNCKILLVEASSNLFSDLRAAVNTAAALGATQISNSYGGPEFASEANDTAYDHPGVAITASAGDDGYAAEYPAASPYVVAVGGTTLNLTPSGGYDSETVWSGSGSGCSAYITARSWQTSDPNWALTECGTKRGVSDVAADANPNTGASVYDTTKVEGQSGWFTVGGTSLSAPLIAGVFALAGGGSADYPAAGLYAHQSDSPASLHDITSGSNGSCGSSTMCKGAVGYDGPTGVGTPKGVAAFGAGGGVDTSPPQTTIDSGPSGPTNDPTPSFGFSSSEFGSTFECRVDAAAFAGCASPFTSNPLSDGAHVFEVRAKDAATNVDPTPAQRSFTVDTTPPQTTIDSGPSGPTNDPTPTFGFSSEAGAGFECRVDAAAFAGCTSPRTAAPLSDGAHSFEVRATDGVGNVDATPASRSFTVDTTPPDTALDAGPEGITNDPTPTFGFSSEAGAGFECRVDAAAFAGCTSPHTTAPLSDGAHTYQVRARDAATNVDPTPAQRSFTVDTTPPQTTIDSGPEGPTNDSTPTFGFSSEQGASFQCRVDSASFAGCTSPYTGAALSDGAHTFEVRASDGGANTDPTPAQRSFTVDTTPPQTTIDSGPAGTTDDSTPSFTFSADEAGSTFRCGVDSATLVPCSSPYTADPLSDGAHSFEVRATDGAGNVDASPASRSFDVDTTAEPGVTLPETTLPEAPPAETAPVLEPEAFPSPRIAPAPVTFSFDGIRHGERGTTKLTVSLPGPGTLVLFGRKVRKVTRTTATGGSVSVPVEPKPRFRNGALGTGRTRVYVTYTPLGGAPVTRTVSLRLS